MDTSVKVYCDKGPIYFFDYEGRKGEIPENFGYFYTAPDFIAAAMIASALYLVEKGLTLKDDSKVGPKDYIVNFKDILPMMALSFILAKKDLVN